MLLNILSIKKAKEIFANNKFYGFYVLMDKLIKEIKKVCFTPILVINTPL